ncbi:MAG: hypothetical protein A2X36_07640 [Elusimicrobia bacterium GWA2_69_24]|nr:MAG: hypothetical protein A2X36_07640 [Elusimicrobia bacterium GWA2_69_24]HBL18590.1 hypothetical protein [Elusimicrobiota bacterium]
MPETIIGKTLGGCRILAQLGEGGMGVAYKAHHLRLDRAVVLKVLHPQLAANKEFIEGFQREARAAARLEHPRIVQVYDVGWQDGYHFIIMQFIDGETLEEKIAREKRLITLKAVIILKAALEGLGEAHRHGMVHRDVKPSNILLAKDGGIRLSDFGIALQVGKGKPQEKGQVVGTPQYMSPEQCYGEPVDARTDIYAMGVTFYYMLAGEPPFEADNVADVLSMHINNPAPDVRKANPDVSSLCSTIIQKMMAKRPDERYQSVPELMSELNAPGVVLEEARIEGEIQMDFGITAGLPALRAAPKSAPPPQPAPPPKAVPLPQPVPPPQVVPPPQGVPLHSGRTPMPFEMMDGEDPPAAVPQDGPVQKVSTTILLLAAAIAAYLVGPAQNLVYAGVAAAAAVCGWATCRRMNANTVLLFGFCIGGAYVAGASEVNWFSWTRPPYAWTDASFPLGVICWLSGVVSLWSRRS